MAQELMSPKNNFWLRIGVEGVVIVLSILLAFGIDAWWDTRRALQLESELLAMVAAEINSNQLALTRMIDDHDTQLATIDRFLRSRPDELLQVPNDSVVIWVRALQRAQTFNPNQEAATLLAQTPIVTQDDLILRALVARYLEAWAEASEDTPVVREMSNDVMALLAAYAVSNAEEGLAAIAPIIARRGPAALVALRRDERLVSTVIHKAMWQRVYRNELSELLVAADSVAAAFR